METKEYRDPYSLIADTCAAGTLCILTATEIDYLCSALDYESIVLRVYDGTVDIVDTITGDVLNTEPIHQFVRNSVLFAIHDCNE